MAIGGMKQLVLKEDIFRSMALAGKSLDKIKVGTKGQYLEMLIGMRELLLQDWLGGCQTERKEK